MLPILLYGCETWLLNTSSLSQLERFQAELGRRILKLPSFFSTSTVCICLCWPSMASRILVRKLSFLAKLLFPQNHSISSHMFTSAAITDPLNISIIQQCRLLESITHTEVLHLCLDDPECAPAIVRSMKEEIFKSDLSRLITLSESHSSHYIAEIARDISWRYLWDLALDRGIQGTHQLQRIIYLLSRPIFNRTYCPTCCVHQRLVSRARLLLTERTPPRRRSLARETNLSMQSKSLIHVCTMVNIGYTASGYI